MGGCVDNNNCIWVFLIFLDRNELGVGRRFEDGGGLVGGLRIEMR